MIEYDVMQHPNGKFRLTEAVNGEKRFISKGKRRFFDENEAAEILRDKQRNNERKAKMLIKDNKIKVNI